MTSFSDLGLPAELCEVLADRGITTPTPIQAATLPDSLAGDDVLGRGRTGSGKTFAFLLPLIHGLTVTGNKPRAGKPRALILAPTRELVAQIEESAKPLADAHRYSIQTVFGGVGQNPQVRAISRGVDIVIACPGRLEDLMGQGHIDLSDVEVVVLDEADHMADLGFLPGVKRILDRVPRDAQHMLFSATLDKQVDILVKKYLTNPVTHEADSEVSPVTTMEHHVFHVDRDDHLKVLTDLAAAPGRTVIFTRTKHRAKRIARQLNAAGVPSVELHGNLSQNARTRTMDALHTGKATTLVATDIAARGIHVDDIGLVVHADPPAEHKAYLHRSGRTARAGSDGVVVTLMTDEQRKDVSDLTRKAGIKPKTTKVAPGHDALTDVAPGEREYPGAFVVQSAEPGGGSGKSDGGSGRRRGGRRGSGGSGSGNSSSRGSNTSKGSRGSGSGRGRSGSRPAGSRAGGGSRSGGSRSGGRRRSGAASS